MVKNETTQQGRSSESRSTASELSDAPLSARFGAEIRTRRSRPSATAIRTNGISPTDGRFAFGPKLIHQGLRQFCGVRCVGMNAKRLGSQDDVFSGRGDYFAFVQ